MGEMISLNEAWAREAERIANLIRLGGWTCADESKRLLRSLANEIEAYWDDRGDRQ